MPLAKLCSLIAVSLLVIGHSGTAFAQAKIESRQSFRASLVQLSEFNSSTNKTPLIRIRIGNRSYWFLLDTGSFSSFIKRSVVKEANLSDAEVAPLSSNAYLNLEKRISIDGKVRGVKTDIVIGSGRVPNVPFLQAPDVALNGLLTSDPSVAGVIGANFLRFFAVAIDYDKNEIAIVPSGKLSSDEVKTLGYSDSVTIPLTTSSKLPNAFLVDSVYENKRLSLLLDTGASTTTLQLPVSESAGETTNTRVTVETFNGREEMIKKTATVGIGTLKAENLDIMFRADGKRLSDIYEGLLGLNFLSQYRVLIDFPAMKMYLAPRSTKDTETKKSL